jgi:hypothetical protein
MPAERDQRDAARRYVLGGRWSGAPSAGEDEREGAAPSDERGRGVVPPPVPVQLVDQRVIPRRDLVAGLERMVVEEAMERLGEKPERDQPASEPTPEERAALREVREFEERRLALGKAFADG